MDPIIRVEDISKRYEESSFSAIDHISIRLEVGKIYCLIGENGSGKSTLLRALAGLEILDSGKIFFKNALLVGPEDKLVPGHPRIKMLKQDATLYQKMSLYDNLRFELKSYSLQAAEARINILLELCGLTEHQKKMPVELSGGQRQRAALAVALADSPEMLILDEPFSNADPIQKEDFKNALLSIFRSSDMTVLFSSHTVEETFSLADHIFCLRKGGLLQEGTPFQIYHSPVSEYVARLTGICNIIETKLLPIELQTSQSSKACIRAEHLLVRAGEKPFFTGDIKEKFFLGRQYQYTLQTKSGLSLKFFHQEALPSENELGLWVKKENVIFFNKE